MKVAAESGRIEGGRTVLHLGATGYFEVPKGGHIELASGAGHLLPDGPAQNADIIVQPYCSAGVQVDHPVLLRDP